MRKIKLLHIITRLIFGGAQEIAISIASELDKNFFAVTLVSGPEDFNKEMTKKWNNVEVILIPDLIRQINPIKDIKALIRLYFFIKKNKFDIVHTHTSKAGILGRIAAKLAGAPVIFHSPHGSIYHSIYYGRRAIFFLSRIENFVAKFTDKIIVSSEQEKKDLLGQGIATADKYHVLCFGIKQDKFLRAYDRTLKRKELGVPEDTILIGNIARLVPEKGHLFCLGAFKMVVERFTRAMLLVVGDGRLRQDIKAKINELDLNGNVIMTGQRDDIAEILAALDISLFTSIWEGTPLAIIEAMLMSKAIIATKVGGIPELIEDGVSGLLVSPFDREMLFQAIVRLINEPKFARRIGEAAHRQAEERFNLATMIENITRLYDCFVRAKIT